MPKVLIKTPEEIEKMKIAGRKLSKIINILASEVRAGLRTMELEKMSRDLIKQAGAEPAFLNYKPLGAQKPYPYCLCVSLNETIVHGQPSNYEIKKGDLVKIDLGLKYEGFYVDAALTLGVEPISILQKRLIATGKEALNLAIKNARAGKTLGDIGWAIEKTARWNGFSAVKNLTGHGIGRNLHEEPEVYNFGEPSKGLKLQAGMVLAIEPMISAGSGEIKEAKDESFVTSDGSLSVHFEETIAVTEGEPLILTPLNL